MTGTVPQYGELDDHHIIPKSKAAELGVGDLIHSILNRTPLTAETNRQVIADRWPSEYLPELIKQNDEQTVRMIMETHFISPSAFKILKKSPFSRQDYEEFITERNRTFLEAIEDMLIKERLDLTPQLRELDQRIERIEINLRCQISADLHSDVSRLPQHVNQKIEERIQAAAKKNATLNSEEFKSILRRLEYCDLRELQDTILNKALWPLFETRFSNKETLATKFGQLAEIRNGIRHSRSVDEITRKEGEAAILWFETLLAR
jgi:hypothetical protein